MAVHPTNVTPVTPVITDELVDTIAGESLSHRHTVERRLLGLPVKGRVSHRVDSALRRRGLFGLVTSAAPHDAA